MWKPVAKLQSIVSGIVLKDISHEELLQIVESAQKASKLEIQSLNNICPKNRKYLISQTVKFPPPGGFSNVEIYTILYEQVEDSEENIQSTLTVIYEGIKDHMPPKLEVSLV